MHTHVLSVEGDIVRKRFVSWDRGEADREWAGLVALHQGEPGLGPVPLERTTKDGAPMIVMSRVPGEPLGTAPLTSRQHRALGLALQRLFAIPATADLPIRHYAAPELRQRLVYAVDGAKKSVDLRAGPVMDALEQAGEWLATDAFATDDFGAAVLGHADGNLANVMWDGLVCRFVDFEDSGSSDPAYEMADLVEHLSSRRDGLINVPELLDRVGLGDERRARLQRYRTLVAIYWLVMLLPGNPARRRNPAGTADCQARHAIALLAT